MPGARKFAILFFCLASIACQHMAEANYDKTIGGLPTAFQHTLRKTKSYLDHLPSIVPMRCFGEQVQKSAL